MNFEKFKTGLKNMGIEDTNIFDLVPEESIHYQGYLNAYIEFLFSYLDDSVKNNINKLSEALSLDIWLSEDMRQSVKESEYITPFEWIEEKLQDYFYVENGIIPKFESKNYKEIEWKYISKEYVYLDIDFPVGKIDMDIPDANWKLFDAILKDKFGIGKMDKLWFHVTTVQSAELAIQNGIVLVNKPNHKYDFGLGPSFYVNDNLMEAFHFVRKKKGKDNHKLYVLVFNTFDILEHSNNNMVVWNVDNENSQVWTDLVKYTMEKKKKKLNTLKPDIKNIDFIYGKISKRINNNVIPRKDLYQLAIKSENGADYFTKHLVGVIQINY